MALDSFGGIIATAAVDEGARRIYFSTAAGDSVINDPRRLRPAQQPTLHALDMDSGAILWQNDEANGFDRHAKQGFLIRK